MKYVVAIDQGTTGTRVQVVSSSGSLVSMAYKEHTQYYPHPGWVEQDPMEILSNVIECFRLALSQASISPSQVTALGITNQRETAVVWDRASGLPIMNAIVWQCRRTADMTAEMREGGLEQLVKEKTGLVLDPYFSASKIKWMLDCIPEARAQAERGKLAFGTIDSWLIWHLTGGTSHITDISNASRTLLFNINSLDWDDDLLALFDVPRVMLPQITSSAGSLAVCSHPGFESNIPITGCAGDQQSATFGQSCFSTGEAKNTYGTGCFLLMVTGDKPIFSRNRLLTTIAWKIGSTVTYALEGSVFVAGAAVGWLRDGLGIIAEASESEQLASAVSDTDGVFFVPALTGLGAPYWDADARGAIVGLTRGTDRRHIARAAIEAMAYQTADLIGCMEDDNAQSLQVLRIDGGASANNLLAQFQSDILGVPVERPENTETTCMGAAYLAGVGCGIWDEREVASKRRLDRVFMPEMDTSRRNALLEGWHSAVRRTLSSGR